MSWLVPEASYVRDPYRRSKPNSYLVEMLLAIKSWTRHDTRNESTAKTSAHISMFESRAATPGPEVPSECPEPVVLTEKGLVVLLLRHVGHFTRFIACITS